MNPIIITIYLVHLLLAGLICFVLNIVLKSKVNKLGVLLITILVSCLTISIVFAFFMYSPLSRLPGGHMDGGLLITFPVMVMVFTVLFFIINTALLLLIKKTHKPRYLLTRTVT